MNAFPPSRSSRLLAYVAVVSMLVLGGCSLLGSGRQYEEEDRANTRSSGDLLTAEQIQKYPSASTVEELLEMHFSGLYIRRGHNNPGASGDVYMLGSSAPLFVIDGVPIPYTGSLGLNPRDIESIELVKFGGTAMYGLRGASGVIVITTKKGRAEQAFRTGTP